MFKNAHRWQTHRWQTWIVALALVAVLATVLLANVASACPTCKEGIDANDPHHQSLAAGFYYSILFMMSMPYIILGSFGYLAFVSIRRAKVQQETVQQAADGAGDVNGEADVR